MKRVIFLVALSCTLFLVAACTSQNIPATAVPTDEPTEAAPVSEGKTFVIAEISDDPSGSIRDLQPVADYLAANLADFGITGGEVKVAPDLDGMVELMANGEVDLFIDSLYPALIVSDGSGAQPILRRWKDGVEEYHTVIFTLKDSGITSIEDLTGEIIAFEEAFSSSGYMLPAAYLIGEGLQLQALADTDDEVPAGAVGYVFTNSDENTLQWVISGRVTAAATDSESYSELPEETRESLVIIAETDPIPRQVVLAGAHLEAAFVTAISEVLQAMDESEEGRVVLEGFDTAQFDEFPEGIEQGLSDLRTMFELVQGQ